VLNWQSLSALDAINIIQLLSFNFAKSEHQIYPVRKLSPPLAARPTMPRVLP
jgi:hypothetical protein